MHGGEEIWECVCASIRSSDFFFFWLRDRCKLKKRKARVGHPGLSRGVVKLTGRPARNAALAGRFAFASAALSMVARTSRRVDAMPKKICSAQKQPSWCWLADVGAQR